MAENIINILKTNNMTVTFVAQESGLDVAQVNETLKRPVATWSIQILNALADDANSQTEGNQLQEVPSQPVSPTVTLPTTAGQPAEIVTLHAQPKQQTVAANNQLINLTPTSINGQKKSS